MFHSVAWETHAYFVRPFVFEKNAFPLTKSKFGEVARHVPCETHFPFTAMGQGKQITMCKSSKDVYVTLLLFPRGTSDLYMLVYAAYTYHHPCFIYN